MIWHLQRERRRRYNVRMAENGKDGPCGLFGVDSGVVGLVVIALAVAIAICLVLA